VAHTPQPEEPVIPHCAVLIAHTARGEREGGEEEEDKGRQIGRRGMKGI
jgi:hypothetical protein